VTGKRSGGAEGWSRAEFSAELSDEKSSFGGLSEPGPADLTIIYDDQCPVCTSYCAALGFDASKVDGVRRVSARSGESIVTAARCAGLDLDSGMAVVHRGTIYHGANALNLLARHTARTGTFNRLNRALFTNPAICRASYPLLRAARIGLLKLLGRSRIR
jgi:predicted DCC family thiol-disulfide oxidoreductase YuxK